MDTESDRQLTRKDIEAREKDAADSRARMEEMRKSMETANQEWRKAQQKLENERDEDKRVQLFDQQVRNLQEDQKKVTDSLSAASPADPKTVQTNLDSLNARATSLKQIADRHGYSYDPSVFAPKSVKSERKHWYSLSPTSTVEEGTTPEAATTAAQPKPPAGAVSVIRDGSGKITGYRMKDGSRRPPTG